MEILEKNKALYKKIETLSKEKEEIYKPALSIQDSDRLLKITKQEKKITNELNLNLKEKIKFLSNPLKKENLNKIKENLNKIAENLKKIDKEVQKIEQNLSNIIIAEIKSPVEKNGGKLFFEKNPSQELANKPIVEALLQKIETGIVCVYKKPSQTQTELMLILEMEKSSKNNFPPFFSTGDLISAIIILDKFCSIF